MTLKKLKKISKINHFYDVFCGIYKSILILYTKDMRVKYWQRGAFMNIRISATWRSDVLTGLDVCQKNT